MRRWDLSDFKSRVQGKKDMLEGPGFEFSETSGRGARSWPCAELLSWGAGVGYGVAEPVE